MLQYFMFNKSLAGILITTPQSFSFPSSSPPPPPAPQPLRHALFQDTISMNFQSSRLHSKGETTGATTLLLVPPLLLVLVVIFAGPASSLSQDGVLLLKFKYSVLSDPLATLGDWNYDDATPCAWNGVVCMGFPDAATLNWTTAGTGNDGNVQSSATNSRVISLVLPNSQLLGSIPPELGLVEHLRHLDLSGNVLNGTLPASLFNLSELRVLSLANNEISGELPELDGRMNDLQSLNLADNALTGRVPNNLMLLPNLTVVSLASNYLSGELPGGSFERLEYLDLSSNLINGSLPLDLTGQRIRYLNLSSNRLSGKIPPELGLGILVNATMDFSFNSLTGEIPRAGAFAVQKPAAFAGNPDLCGKPLRNLCTIPSTLSDPPNSSTVIQPASKSPPAFAAIPKDTGASSADEGKSSSRQSGLRPAVVIAIIVGDVAGIAALFMVFLYVYQVKKKKREHQQQPQQVLHQNHFKKETGSMGLNRALPPPASPESKGSIGALSCCLRKKAGDGDDTEETSETSASSETDEEGGGGRAGFKQGDGGKPSAQQKQHQGAATLVTVDGESELELETLLKASAYILGASGSSIVYKAVLGDGTALAVRRIGESSAIDKLKDFDAQVRAIAKFRHPNLLRLRGFYWGPDEKLVIHDYAPNGSVANISFSKKLGSSPFHLTWDARLRIARGVARGLAYLHDKKSVHGNVKPSNILLDADMEPKIGDFGLERLMSVDGSYKFGTSARQFGSKRSVQSSSSLPDLSPLAGASPCGSASTSATAPPPYLAPESLKNLKPNAKWDVYAFGMVLLELLAGKVFSEVELCQWNAGFMGEERNRVLRMADPAMRGEVEGKEEALLSCFKLGFACCATAPQKRPSMKDAAQVLDKLPSSSSSSASASSCS